jgi:hypothetical protein
MQNYNIEYSSYCITSHFKTKNDEMYELFKDQIDFYPELIDDLFSLFTKDIGSTYGCSSHDFLQDWNVNTVADIVLKNNNLLSYLSKHKPILFIALSRMFIDNSNYTLSDFHLTLFDRVSDGLFESKNASCIKLGLIIKAMKGFDTEYVSYQNIYDLLISCSKTQSLSAILAEDILSKLIVGYCNDEDLIIKEFEKIKREEGYQEKKLNFMTRLVDRNFISDKLSKFFTKKLTKRKRNTFVAHLDSKICNLRNRKEDTRSLQFLLVNIINESSCYDVSYHYRTLDVEYLVYCLPTLGKTLHQYDFKRIQKTIQYYKMEKENGQ